MQKGVFCTSKGRLLQRKRAPFTSHFATYWLSDGYKAHFYPNSSKQPSIFNFICKDSSNIYQS